MKCLRDIAAPIAPAEFVEKPCRKCGDAYSSVNGTRADHGGLCFGCSGYGNAPEPEKPRERTRKDWREG